MRAVVVALNHLGSHEDKPIRQKNGTYLLPEVKVRASRLGQVAGGVAAGLSSAISFAVSKAVAIPSLLLMPTNYGQRNEPYNVNSLLTLEEDNAVFFKSHRKGKNWQKHSNTRSGGDPEEGRYGGNKNNNRGDKNKKYIPNPNPNKKPKK